MKKSIVELIAERDALVAERDHLITEARAILAKGKEEKRKMNDGEMEDFDALRATIAQKGTDIEAKNAEIETENRQKSQIKTEEKMENVKFSLAKAILNAAEGRAQDEVAQAVFAAGKAASRASNLPTAGNIVLPVGESRSAVTVTASSGATVPVDVAELFTPLRADTVLAKAGAKMYTGLQGDLKIPVLGAGSVAWASEVGDASDAGYSASSTTMKPLRITAKVPISKQLLIQDATNIDAAIMADLSNAVYEKLEATILGDAAGESGVKPAGIFYGATIKNTPYFSDVCNAEATLEAANVKSFVYVASPKAKAAMRAMTYNDKTRTVFSNNNLDGVQVFTTSNVPANKYIIGDFSNMVIGQWGALDIVVDNVTLAANAEILLVINAWFDVCIARSAAFVECDVRNAGTCAAPTFSPASWSSGASQTITLSCATSGATIYYTTDGSDPDRGSTAYDSSNKPSITATTTFKAIAVKDGWLDSAVASKSYTKPD